MSPKYIKLAKYTSSHPDGKDHLETSFRPRNVAKPQCKLQIFGAYVRAAEEKGEGGASPESMFMANPQAQTHHPSI